MYQISLYLSKCAYYLPYFLKDFVIVYKSSLSKDFDEKDIEDHNFDYSGDKLRQNKKIVWVKNFLRNLKNIGLELDFVIF